MIQKVRAIGQIVRAGDVSDFVELAQKDDLGDDDKYKITIIVNVNDKPDENGNFVSTKPVAYTKTVYRDGLSYVNANFFMGTVLRQEKYSGADIRAKNEKAGKSTTDEELKKNKEKYLSKCLEFLEVPQVRYAEVIKTLDVAVQSTPDDTTLILFMRNGQKPIDVFKDKFVDAIKNNFGRIENSGICQLCGSHAKSRYDTCGYNCYTDDKRIYRKTIDGLSYSVCEDCLMDILLGRRYVDRKLTAWWGGSNVIFLPSTFNEKVKDIFDACGFGDHPDVSLLRQIRENESRVFSRMGECNTGISIIFFRSQKSEWKITYNVNAVASSRFARIAELKNKYRSIQRKKIENEYIISEGKELSLKIVIYYLLGEIKETKGGLDLRKIFASNASRRYLNDILHGYAIDRDTFFSRAMKIYEHNFLQGYKSLSTVHRVYNFLVDAGCLENGWKIPLYGEGDTNMSAYKSEDEFFEVNKNYFDTNEKKAWFVLGRLYSAMIWESKKYYKKDRGTETEGPAKEGNDQYNGSYLEKNFFFGRKYDWDTFLYFANQCFDLAVKYGALHKKYIKEFNSKLKEFMVPAENKNVKLSPEEAKYIFAWGMSQWFEIDKEHIDPEETETAENEIKENEDGAEVPDDNEETNEDGEK